MTKVCVILGASGLTGSFLLEKLLNYEGYEKVIAIGRRNLFLDMDQKALDKLEEHVINFRNFTDYSYLFRGVNDVFCCLGYGTSPGGFREVEFVYPSQAAKFSAEHNIDRFIVMTGMLSNSGSSIDLFRVKGELQDQVRRESLTSIAFIQPALIVGDRAVARSDEKAMYGCFKWISPIVELLIRKPMYNFAENIADAMLYIANSKEENDQRVSYYDSGAIKRLAKKSKYD